MYTRVYDLASAFDTVEFSVLLEKLFNAGIHGKSWRFVLWSHQPSEVGKSAVKFLQYLLNPPELCTLSLIFFYPHHRPSIVHLEAEKPRFKCEQSFPSEHLLMLMT